MTAEISVYGADWCDDTQRSRRHLEHLGISYRYINVDKDEDASRKVIEWNNGKRLTPTIVISSSAGTVRLAEPSNAELDHVLGQHGLTRVA